MPTEISNSSRGKYAEAFRHGLVMSLAQKKEDKLELLFPTTTCKDFLNDVLWAEKTGLEARVYGFHWTKIGILNKPLYIVLNDGDNMTKDSAKNLEKNLKFFAEKFGQKQGKVHYFDKHLYTKVDKGWHEHPYLFALYTLFMSSYDKKFATMEEYYEEMRKDKVRAEYFNEKENQYSFHKTINFILSGKKFKFMKYTDCGVTSTIHNNSGLVDIKNQNKI